MSTQQGFLKVELNGNPVGTGVLVDVNCKYTVIRSISTGKHIAGVLTEDLSSVVDVTKGSNVKSITLKQLGSMLGIEVVDLTPKAVKTGRIGRGVGC